MFAVILDETNKERLRTDLNQLLKELSIETELLQHLDLYWEKVEERYPIGFISNGNYIGFCLIEYILAEKTFFIEAFYILSEYRNQGLGTQALEKVKGFCLSIEENPRIKVALPKDVRDAKGFFEKQHFEMKEEDEYRSVYIYGQK